MNVTCTACQTVFRVDPAKVPTAGVRARCSVCSGVFWVRHLVPTAPPEPELEPATVAAPAAPPPVVAVVPPPPPPEPIAPPLVVAAVRPPAVAPASAATPAVPIAAEVAVAPVVAPRPAGPAVAPPVRRSASDTPGAPPSFERPSARTVLPPFTSPSPHPAPPAAPALPRYPLAVAAAPEPAQPPPKKARVNPFLRQDPAAKARRLARALISDMVVYHPAKRREGLQNASLKRLFDEEIRKSWEEYVDQVGKELAESTDYFQQALNEILADGQPVFP